MRSPSMGLFRAGSLTFLSRLLIFVASIGLNILLARALGPRGRGIYTLALLVPSMMFLVANLGIGSANVYFLGKRTFSVSTIISQSIALSLVLGLVTTAITIVIIRGFGSAIIPGVDIRYIILPTLALPLILMFNLVQTVFQGLQRFIEFNLVLLIGYGAQVLFLAVAVLLLRTGVEGAVIAWGLSAVPTTIAALALASRYGRVSLRLDRKVSRALLGFGIVAYLSNLTSFMNLRFDSFLVNLFAGTRDVGLYAVGVGMAETVWYLSIAAATVLAPRVTQADAAESERVTATASRIVLFMTVLASLALAALAPLLVKPLFGPQFADSATAVWLLLPGVGAMAVQRVLASYLLGRNRLRVDLAATAAGLAVTLAMDLALIPRYGFAGAAVASSIAYAVTMLVDVTWVVQHSSLSVADLFWLKRSDVRLLLDKLPAFTRAA